jgi:hypothetical protein
MTDQGNPIEQDYQNYKVLLELWSKENPIKTTKLQMLLAVNGLLASAVNISGGVRDRSGISTWRLRSFA